MTDIVVKVSSNEYGTCTFCSEVINGENNFVGGVNHYIKVHGCKLLHVGTETLADDKGGPWHTTVAVLGK